MTGWDLYLDLETGVLRNRLGITSAEELARAEADLTALRLIELRHEPPPGTYDLAHLQAFHRHIFGDVYGWAGQLRTVSIGKGQAFCLPQHLESFADEVLTNLHRNDLLRGRDRDEFVSGLADLLGDINALHPFREGNGGTACVPRSARRRCRLRASLDRDGPGGEHPRLARRVRGRHQRLARDAHPPRVAAPAAASQRPAFDNS